MLLTVRNPGRECGTRNPEQKDDIRDVVFLHGWGLDAGVWDEVAARLAARFRVRALDLPGYGATPACVPYALPALADAVARAAPPRCHVVAWSLGGQVALHWAAAAPQQVRRVALVAATPCFVRRPGWAHAIEPEVLAAFAQELKRDAGGALKRFLLLQAQGDARARQVARRLRAALAARPRPSAEALEGGLEILQSADLRGALRSVAQRALVLHGDRDALAPLGAGEYLARELPNARVAVLPGAAHAPLVSAPHAVGRLLEDFLDER